MGHEWWDESEDGEEAGMSQVSSDLDQETEAYLRKGEEETNASRRERPGNGRSREVNMTNDVRIAMNDIDRTMERLRTGTITA